MNYSLSVRCTNQHSNIVFVPPSLLKNGENFRFIAFGTKIVPCKVKKNNENEQSILLSKNIWEQLRIPYEATVHIILHDATIHIGSLIGIFTAGFTDSLLRPVGDRSFFFAKLLEVQNAVGSYAFIFGAHQINWTKGIINGFFHTDKGWTQIEVPFPHVVYDRLPNRRTENHDTLKKIKMRLQHEYMIPWFNPGFFNKWDIHNILTQDQSTKPFLPETFENPSIKDIQYLLNKYTFVYIKPKNGSLGNGINQIINSDGAYECRYHRDKQTIVKRFSSLENLINHQYKNQLKNYIVQQGISLIKVKQKPLDFRIHTNKNESGKWEVSAIGIKVAGPTSITTHLKTGGSIKTIDEVFKDLQKRKNLIQKLKIASLNMSHILDEHIDGMLGEVGFDIGVDKNQDIWLFEANSKPGRSIFSHPKLKDSDLYSRKLSMSYALFLTKMSIKHPEELYR